MTTRETIIDHSGRYEVIDPDGKLVTEIGAPVVFDSFDAAEAFLKRRNR